MKISWRAILPIAGLLALIGVVYLPAFRGEFIWDDLLLVHENPLVKGDFSLRSIWFQADFPLATIALWLQWLAWGENPVGYHAVNIALHTVNSALVWALLQQMRIPGAWLAAALFAVHPVTAVSAVWISEIKNTLSLSFYLLALGSWVRAHVRGLQSNTAGSPSIRVSPAWYALSLMAFFLALLSKTSTVMLPVILLLWAWWSRGRVTRQDLVRTSPFFVLSLVFGLLTIWLQQTKAISGAVVQNEQLWMRVPLAAKAIWFYAVKAVAPFNLSMIYPRWQFDPRDWYMWLAMAVTVLFAWLFWRVAIRDRALQGSVRRAAVLGLGFFAINLFPVLGFFDMYYLAISRVSDHLQYLPIIGVLAVIAAVIHSIPFRRVTPLLGVMAVGGLAALSFSRAKVLASDENLWLDTLAKNDRAWTAHNNLGCILAEKNDLIAALDHFERSVELNPQNARALGNLGHALTVQGRAAEALPHLEASLKLKPESADVRKNYGTALACVGKTPQAIEQLHESLRLQPDPDVSLELAGLLLRQGQPHQAIAALRDAIQLRPDFPEALNNLAWLLATAADDSLRDRTEAVKLATRACALTRSAHPVYLATLAAAYANDEKFDNAVATADKAHQIAMKNGNPQFAAIVRILRNKFQSRQPWREPAAVH